MREMNSERVLIPVAIFVLLSFLFLLYMLIPYWEVRAILSATDDVDVVPEPFFRHGCNFLLLYFIALFNYFYLIERFLLRRRYLHYVLGLLTAAGVLIVADQLFWSAQQSDLMLLNKQLPSQTLTVMPYKESDSRERPSFDTSPVFILTIIVALTDAFAFGRKYFAERVSNFEIEKSLLHAELAMLRNQIEPHFFFNALNNIHSMIGRDVALAKRTVFYFSKIMRYVMSKNTPEVELHTEIEFIEHYIQFQQQCFNHKIHVNLNIRGAGKGIMVPSMIFLPLLENAFKYGVDTDNTSGIEIFIEGLHTHVLFRVRNTKCGRKPDERFPSHGIGLINVQRKLELMYPSRHEFSVCEKEDRFDVMVKINGYEK